MIGYSHHALSRIVERAGAVRRGVPFRLAFGAGFGQGTPHPDSIQIRAIDRRGRLLPPGVVQAARIDAVEADLVDQADKLGFGAGVITGDRQSDPAGCTRRLALFEKIGPGILLVHSQAGAMGWPVADKRPDLIKAVLAIEPNGPPVRTVEFIGEPNWFKEGPIELEQGTALAGDATALGALGHTTAVRVMNSGLHAIAIEYGDEDKKVLSGAVDPRREGVALGD